MRGILLFCLLLFFGCARQVVTPQKQAEADQKAIVSIQKVLVGLPLVQEAPQAAAREIESEAHLIATSLVNQTRETNEEFNMTTGPKWHNFLIKIGARKKGYCYEWVPELLKALPSPPMKYFERHWGGSFLSLGRENNAVIITKRGAALETGLVYDAWRGSGHPFWILVSQDKKYSWMERFTEMEILTGQARVEPK